MNHTLADRLLLMLVLEVGALLVGVSLAASALGPYLAPTAVVGALVACAVAIPVVVSLPAFAARPERLPRWIGVGALVVGTGTTLGRSHDVADVTILLVGIGLLAYAAHDGRRRRRSADRTTK